MAQRCTVCNGSKQIVGLGNMLKDCENCDAVGYVAEKKDDEPVQEKKVTSIKERRERFKHEPWQK